MTSRIGRISHLDGSALLRVQAGVNFINAEVARRRRHVKVGRVVGAIVGLLVVLRLWALGDREFRIVGTGLGAFGLVWGAVALHAVLALKKSYKQVVVSRVVSALGHGLTYSPRSTLVKKDFVGMHLFDPEPEAIIAEDEIRGRKNDVTYSLHEVRAFAQAGLPLRVMSHLPRAPVRQHAKDDQAFLFDGVVVRLDFNKNFAGHTIVVSQAQSHILGGLLGEASRRRSKEIVRLENPDFNSMFAVYSTDQQQARYVLTPRMMELIMEAQAHFSGELKMSFHDNSLFVTVPQGRDRFEVRLFGGPVGAEDSVSDLVEVVGLAERLIDTLELETRIWSRV